jgi:hypothetical protein
LIDYENVQPKLLDELAADHFKVIVFVGASQTKISFEAGGFRAAWKKPDSRRSGRVPSGRKGLPRNDAGLAVGVRARREGWSARAAG